MAENNNMRIVYPNLLDILTSIAAESEEAALPVENLQSQRRGQIWRSQDATDTYITGNWAAPQEVDFLGIPRHNLSAAGSIRLRLYAGLNQTGTVLYDSTVVALGDELGYGEEDYGLFDWGGATVFASSAFASIPLYFRSAGVSLALSFRLDISDAANPDGHFEFTRVVLGKYVEFSEGASAGSGWWWEESGEQSRSRGGSLVSDDAGVAYRRWEIKLGLLTEDDRQILFRLAGDAAYRDDMYLSMHPEDGTEKEVNGAGLVKIVSLPRFTSKPEASQLSETAIVFEES